LNKFFDRMVNVERIKLGNWQTIDTLISEEALLFAKYLRHERALGQKCSDLFSSLAL